MRMLRILLTAFLCILLAACGTNIVGRAYYLSVREAAKSRPAYKQFQELCSSPDRSRIYKTVNVDGYLFASTNGARCNGGWDVLAIQGYKYHECSTAKVLDYDSVTQGEIYRLKIGEKDDARCVPWSDVEADIGLSDKVKEIKRLVKGKCFIKSTVSEPKSNYAKLFESGYVDEMGNHIIKDSIDRPKKNYIRYWGVSVFNLNTKDIMSVDRDYQYWPEGISNKAVGKYTCDEDVYVIGPQVLIPQ